MRQLSWQVCFLAVYALAAADVDTDVSGGGSRDTWSNDDETGSRAVRRLQQGGLKVRTGHQVQSSSLQGAVLCDDEEGAEEKIVNIDNFYRAESDNYLNKYVNDGALGEFQHTRLPASVDQQTVVRMNQDTLYSGAVVDLGAGPVTVIFPEPDDRYVTLHLVSQDMDSFPHIYDPGEHVFTKEDVGTRYVALLLRVFMNEHNKSDIEAANRVQDGFKIQQESKGCWKMPAWSQSDLTSIRKSLVMQFEKTVTPLSAMFGMRKDMDRLSHLLGTANGWGANQAVDSTFVSVTPKANDGSKSYTLRIKDVPLDYDRHGFWSVTVYNASGYMEPNKRGINSYNHVTAKHQKDGEYVLYFGDCSKSERGAGNCIDIMPGWNYCVLLYVPLPPLLNGSWRFPEAVMD